MFLLYKSLTTLTNFTAVSKIVTMCIFVKNKCLPTPSGQFNTSCVDVMTEFSNEGIFFRLHYPTGLPKQKEKWEEWVPWIPDEKYTQGLAFVVGLWVFIIKVAMWWYGGKMYIPTNSEAELLSDQKRKGKKLPVIIFSHGFGASRFLCSSLLIELASQGYAVASLEHRDTTACATYYYKSAAHRDRGEKTWIPHNRLQFGAEHYPLRNNQVKYRKDECIKALEVLKRINEGDTSCNVLKTTLDLQGFKGQLDLDQVTVMGHSFGGATALLALNSDSRFRQGVILDGWMFPLKEESLKISQPLLFINSQTFHISSNLIALDKIIRDNKGAPRQFCYIKNSTHETQTDTPLVLGYWLDWFRPKVDPTLGNMINNSLIIKFLENYTGVPQDIEHIESILKQHKDVIMEDVLPPAAPVRKGFFQALFA